MSRKTKFTATKEEARPALVPKLRFPEFRNSEGWKVRLMGDLFSDRQESGLTGLPLLSLMDKEGIVPQENSNRKNNSNSDKSKYLRVVPGDIAYNTMRMWEGRSAHVGMEGLVSPAYTVCEPKADVHSVLFSYYFKTPQLIEQFRRYSQGLVKDTLNLKYAAFSQILVPTPTLPEQQKIAECLSSVDELMAAQALKVDALKTHKKGLMQQLFPREGETQPRLRFPEFQNAGEWVPKTGAEITSKITKGSSPNWQGFSYQTQGVLFITSENVRDGFLDVSEPKFLPEEFFAKQSNSHLLYGDILINIVGASIGRNCVYRLKEPAFTNQAVALFRVTKEHSFEFVSYCYQQDRSQKAVTASQSDSARPNLSLADLRSMEFFIPSLPEQQRIADCLTNLDDLIAAQTQKLEALKTHKKGLMQQLFPSPEEVEG